MPTYDYLCKKCKRTFTTNLTIQEYEKKKAKCPHCGSARLQQQVTSFKTKTSRKS